MKVAYPSVHILSASMAASNNHNLLKIAIQVTPVKLKDLILYYSLKLWLWQEEKQNYLIEDHALQVPKSFDEGSEDDFMIMTWLEACF